ncbi:hypothetical protein Rhe02_37070 [Rhizocola hellebori]|uniref:Uncharacterized protein n=1 Tax=Rhizocola hellebori TaxID=1392758 RepID=A0A8J3Q867_9ACTN|nr:hypothetical protein Rhe02_37070 [Rhizocola hellebori]
MLARTDTQLFAYDLDRAIDGETDATVFAAPWPWRVGTSSASPDLSFAVFSGVHAVQAVDAGGGMRWEVRHSCWEGSCLAQHGSYAEYADDRDHRHPESGSARVSGDGRTVWLHLRGPLPGDELPSDHDPWGGHEQWLVVDAADAGVLGRIATDTDAGGSFQFPHPDPSRMALNVGEGQDGSVIWLGQLKDGRLQAEHIGQDDEMLIGILPSGRTYATIGHSAEEELSLHRFDDTKVIGTLLAMQHSAHEDKDVVRWEAKEIGAVDERTIVVATGIASISGIRATEVEHWLVDVDTLQARGPIHYPDGTPPSVVGIGKSRWMTKTPGVKLGFDVWTCP